MDQSDEHEEKSLPTGMRMTVVIIAASGIALMQVVSFLERRGIRALVFTDLQQALDAIKNETPFAILLSINFPHSRVEQLPSLFQNNLNIDCLAFAETHDRKTSGKLTACKARQIIYGPLSGQVIWMRLRQMQLKAQRSQYEFDSLSLAKKAPQSQESESIRVNSRTQKPGGVIFQRGMKFGAGGFAQFQSGDPRKFKAAAESGRLNLKHYDPMAPEREDGTKPEIVPSPSKVTSISQPNSSDRILRRCTREALAEFCDSKQVSQDFLSEYSSAWVMRMKMIERNATLVFAIGATEQSLEPHDFLRPLVKALMVSMEQKNLHPIMDGTTLIRVHDNVAVSDALLLNSFSARSRHFDTDVSVAVFSHAPGEMNLHPEIVPSENGMFAVPIASFRENVTPGFDAFLLLPLNEKKLHYSRKGRAPEARRTATLITKGATHFLIRPEDVVEYNRYHALSHIFKKTKV